MMMMAYHMLTTNQDVLWTLENSVDFSRITSPTIMVANPTDHVVNFYAAASRFLELSPHAPKLLSCVTTR